MLLNCNWFAPALTFPLHTRLSEPHFFPMCSACRCYKVWHTDNTPDQNSPVGYHVKFELCNKKYRLNGLKHLIFCSSFILKNKLIEENIKTSDTNTFNIIVCYILYFPVNQFVLQDEWIAKWSTSHWVFLFPVCKICTTRMYEEETIKTIVQQTDQMSRSRITWVTIVRSWTFFHFLRTKYCMQLLLDCEIVFLLNHFSTRYKHFMHK